MSGQDNGLEIACDERACGGIIEQAGSLGLIVFANDVHSNLLITPSGQIRISKFETKETHSNPKSKTRNPKMSSFGILRFLIMEFVSNFGFRVLDFLFCHKANFCRALPSQRSPPAPVRSRTFSAVLLAAPTPRRFSYRSCAPICRCIAPIRKSMPAPPRRAPSPAAAGLHPDTPASDARKYPRTASIRHATGCPRQRAFRALLQRDSPHYPMR